MFYFFKEAEDGTYNLMEIYSDRKGNLTAKTFYKTRKDATQRVMDIEKSLLPTSETYSGAILSNAKLPQMFESTSIEDDFSAREGVGSYTDDEVSIENDPISKDMARTPVFTFRYEFLNSNDANSPHSYEVTKIELTEDSTVAPTSEARNPLNRSTNSISATKLLNGVEKSYDKGKSCLMRAKMLPK